MPKKINKKEINQNNSSERIHKGKGIPDNLIRFSFRHFTVNEKFFIPSNDADKYLPILLERLKDVSTITVNEFRNKPSKSLRNHVHDWIKTTEAKGYCHLNEQLQQCEPWQFCLSANEYGRVHGVLIDEVFYVVWLDKDHCLYE